VIVEVDGASTAEEFRVFARTCRIPHGLRESYVRFAMRTVVGVAPDTTALAHSFAGLSAHVPTITRIGEMPFLLAVATAH
jgi:hypothetical protein